MPTIGPLEIVVVLVVALMVLGPKRLPDVGRSVGRGLREFKESVTGRDDDGPVFEPASLERGPGERGAA